MTPKLLIRIAAVLIFIHAFGHTIGHSGWKKAPDPVEHQVIQQMTGHKFPFMGVNRSLAEYFDGYGYACSIALFIIAAILFIVAADLPASIKLAKKIVLTLSVGLLVWAIDEWIFFFPFAAAITFLAFVSSLLAYYLLSKQSLVKTE
jgi:hypothetical protein